MRVGDISYLRLVVDIATADNPHSNGQGGEVKPNPIKAFLRLSDLFNILFSQAQEIKRLRAENAAKDAIILKITRHAEGITKAWNDGVLSLNEIKK